MSKIYEYLYFEVFSIKLYKYIIKFIYKPPKMHIPQELRIRSGGTERHSASN